MDGDSEQAGDSAGESEDGESVASWPSDIKAGPGPGTPPEHSEPEPEPQPEEVETEEGGAAAGQRAEGPEGPAASEAAGEDRPGEPESPAEPEPEPEHEPEPEERTVATAEEPGEPEKAAEEEAKEEAVEEAVAEEEKEKEEGEGEGEKEEEEVEEEEKEEATKKKKKGKKEGRLRVSLQLTTTDQEEAAPAPARRGEEGDRESQGGERETTEAHKVKREEEQKTLILDRENEDYEWSEEVQKEQEQQLRNELLDQYHALVVERNRYQRYNSYLQHKICEALRKKKGLEVAEAPDRGPEPEAPEKEQAYLRYLAILEDLKKQEADDLEWYHQELGQLKQQCQEKLARVEKEWRRFQGLKKQVVMQAMGSCRSRGGRQAALREVEQIQALEDKKEKEMSAVRLENVQLRQSLVHFQTRMRAQEDLADGLLLIDFEQLKIENQTFNEKVEERNEELLKLRNKVTNNVQVVTHVKEKLNFIDMKNTYKKAQLLEVEAQVALGRDMLTKIKQARDSLRVDNIKLNQKCGLLGKESLLLDLEEKVDKTEQLTRHLESLKRHHAGLTLSCKGVKQKIREAKAFLPS